MPWTDVGGTLAAIGVSILLAFLAFDNGRWWYRTGFYLSLGNILISLLAFFGEIGSIFGGWWAFPYYLVISTVSYTSALGSLVIFRRPKAVKCFRCEYVSWPSETDEQYTPFSDLEWQQFRKLNSEVIRHRHSQTEPLYDSGH